MVFPQRGALIPSRRPAAAVRSPAASKVTIAGPTRRHVAVFVAASEGWTLTIEVRTARVHGPAIAASTAEVLRPALEEALARPIEAAITEATAASAAAAALHTRVPHVATAAATDDAAVVETHAVAITGCKDRGRVTNTPEVGITHTQREREQSKS